MKKVNKRDLIETLADRGHLSIKEAQSIVDIVFDEIEARLLKGESVNISNFGVFESRTRQARVGTDPKTHKVINLKETKTVVFRPAKTVKDKLN